MAHYLIKGNGIISLGSISSEEDLLLKERIHVNPPPSNGKCDCCGRHLSKLEPFGKAGDPLVGDFDGELLVKTWRRDFPPDDEAEQIWEAHFGACQDDVEHEQSRQEFIKKHGEDEYEDLLFRMSACSQIRSTWLCRDCMILDDDAYYSKLYPSYAQKLASKKRANDGSSENVEDAEEDERSLNHAIENHLNTLSADEHDSDYYETVTAYLNGQLPPEFYE